MDLINQLKIEILSILGRLKSCSNVILNLVLNDKMTIVVKLTSSKFVCCILTHSSYWPFAKFLDWSFKTISYIN